MAIQFSTTYRNAMLDQFETTVGTSAVIKIFSGTVPAHCSSADPSGTLITYSLASDWAAAASGGTKQLNNLPITGTASATGTAASYRLYASDGTTCHSQGTVTATGGGGDITIDNTSIVNTQTVNITAGTFTAPGA